MHAQRGIERGEQQRRALWAKCGVATPEQFYGLVDTKAKLVEMKDEFDSPNDSAAMLSKDVG